MIEEYENKVVTVEVTREDIDNGIRFDSNCCPIALAVCRALGESSDIQRIEVAGGVEDSHNVFDILTNQNLMPWIRSFDQQELALPFSFTIKIFERQDEEDIEEDDTL